ncbi:TonB-dependent receptor [Gluconacetobacter johannae DSM 13595]|uniref:TonB-dependent receptor n=1 Tax=Gluconacetobacter johannae TaxID=112140 RepID=A0A7W4P6S6_9PROT|nr:TonB-dependent receptor [Gluconacetobacter johannae]MBB2176190.1 TonB-dependent receptor [Gluconacetobacter johannae]GBQ89227.1 TonB-dependent receptor [Gluconacetobacter johannae DSM 13595]
MLSRTCLTILLASTAISGFAATTAVAQGAAPASSSTSATTSPAPATTAKGGVSDAAPEEVAVTGRSARTRSPGGGLLRVETEPKAVQTITRDFIAKQSPTTNIQQLLRMLPSANVSDQDPFGLTSGQTEVRGMDQTQIGWLLDGMPLNDIGGGQFYSNEVLEAEDLESVSLQPGSVNIDSPVVNASAGLVTATMSNPTHQRGGLLDISFGSFDTHRQFLRLNSGDIGTSGLRAMFAFSHTDGNNWRGPGRIEKFHYDFKAVKDFENGSHTGMTVSYNDQVNDFMLNPSLAQYNATGYSTNYDANYSGIKDTNYYKLHVNPFRNVIVSAPTHIVVTPDLSIDDTVYFWHGIGNGTGASVLTEGTDTGGTATEGMTYMGNQPVAVDLNGDGKITPGAQAIVFSPSNQEQFRTGNTLKFNYQIGRHHTLTAGWWYEYSNLDQYSPIGMVNQTTGQPLNIWGTKNIYTVPGGDQYRSRDFLTLTQINMLFVGDTMKYFNDRLRIDLGFKEAMVTRRTYDYTPGTTYNRNLHNAEPLPQVGLSWTFNSHHQIYVAGSTNFRVPSNTSLVDYYSTAGKQTQTGGSSAPEYSISEEIGYRYNGDLLVGSISFFNYNFTNKQLSLSYYDPSSGTNYSRTVNAGGQTSRGVDVQLATRPLWFHLRPYATFEYLNARIDNDLATTGKLNGVTINDALPTRGKTQIRSPKVQAALGLDYDDGRLFISGNVKYVDKQYATLMDDSYIPRYITDSVNIGYRFSSFGFLKGPQIQLNMQNLTNAKFRSGIGGFANNLNATTGVRGSTISGSNGIGSPYYYLQAPFTAIVTASTAF